MSTVTADAESQSRRVGCAHCGLPAPPPAADTQLSFCCRGCQGAYELIRGWGLEEYYDLRDCPSSESKVDDAAAAAYSDLDDPSLLGRSAPFPVGGESGQKRFRSRLSLSGLHCVACVWLIERASERVEGWQSSTVNMHARTVDIVFDPEVIPLSRIALILHRIGYRVAPLSDEDEADLRMDDQKRMLVDIAVAGFCAANAMWVAIALYAGQFSGIAAGHAQILRVAGVLLGGLAVLFPGRVFFRSAWASWTTRTPHMDLPVAVGLSAGLGASLYGLFDSTREIYFDSIACLVLFLLVGRWIQMRQQRRAGQSVSDLIRLAPTIASRVEPNDEIKRVRADTLVIGDRVQVNPGESIPVDGIVVDGESAVDRSLLTGESRPVAVSQGSVVEAGTENLQAALIVRASSAVADTRFAAISRAVAEAAQSRTPIVQLANRVGGWFVVVVLALAAVTALIWWFRDPARITSSVVSLLIVACPCALALATPLALAVAIGRLARQRVLIREGDCLERIATPGTIFFDKTGTLTEGRMRVTEWNGDSPSLAAVAAIEKSINHPIAKAVCQCAGQHRAELCDASEVNQTVGQGVSGVVQGAQYVIGGTRVARDRGISMSPQWQQLVDRIRTSGASPIMVIRDDQLVAVFGVTDPVRAGAAGVIQYYHSRGWRIGIISGDDQRTVDHVARQLEIDPALARGELLPVEKLRAIEAASGERPVMMVGDGVNDAAALAAADVGIAISGGAAASLSAAPVMIGDGNLEKVTLLADAAARTRHGIRQNFAISIGYNAVAVLLAMMGTITPLLAALLMPISSVTVLALTLARPTFSETES